MYAAHALLTTLPMNEIILQLKLHRFRELEMDKETKITGLSKLNKKQKAEVVLAAIERWMACVNAGEVPLKDNQLPEPLECEESVVESDEDE
ncbi:hypothetical protein B0H19DRAFT_1263760 [Mycena capillaripes]|nr:hypothetical protein B0H19DRAFT_1263760 [Mycena capillaripes]